MILIGQYDSPFVRRVAIALTLYGFVFEHRPWSTFGDGDLIAPFNPLRRVPTLVLEDGSVVIESAAIIDWIEESKGNGHLIAKSGPERRKTLYYMALSMGFSDKCVALFYEKVLHEQISDIWTQRLETQIAAVLDRLNAIRSEAATQWLLGPYLGHADIALGCAIRHARDAHGDAIDWTRWPALIAHSDACETLPIFDSISQPFRGPATS